MTPTQIELLSQLELFPANHSITDVSARFHRLLDLAWHYTMAESPDAATANGFPGYDDRWPDYSADGWRRRRSATGIQLRALSAIDRSALTADDQLSYDLFKRSLDVDAEELTFPTELTLVTQMDGPHQNIPRMLSMMSAQSAEQRENILRRLEAVPAFLAQTTDLLAQGIERGITPPRACVAELPQQVLNQIIEDPHASPMLAAFERSARTDKSVDFIGACEEARAIFTEQITPALKSLHTFLRDRYLPACRTTTAWTDLPNGLDWYRFLVRRHTTTDLTPDQIFDIGMSEVTRIKREMQAVIASANFSGDFAAWCEFLRTDPRFFCTSAAELLTTYRDISKRVDPELARLFGTLPRLPYGVTPIPSYAEKSQTTAYYEPGSPAAGRPGYFYANTYDLKSRPKWEMEALTLHEAVPGHHLQIALDAGIAGHPRIQKIHVDYRLRRGLGALFRTPRRGHGLLRRPLRQIRPAHLRDVARHPPRRRSRPARQGLDSRASHCLLHGEFQQVTPRHPGGNRPLHRMARPGTRL